MDAPDVRTADRRRYGRHGDTSGTDYLGPRTITVSVEVSARDDREFSATMDTVARAFAPGTDTAPLVFRFPGVAGSGTRYVVGKTRKRAAPITWSLVHHHAVVTAEIYCPSPWIHDVLTQTGQARLPTAGRPGGGGIRFPTRFPVRTGAAPAAEVIRATNHGTTPAPMRLRFRGPITDPRVTNLRTGEFLELRYTLLAGQWLDVDTDTREVLLNGSAPRWLTPGTRNTWLHLAPGTAEFGLSGYRIPGEPGEPDLTAWWSSTWI
ncbi:phage tail family protein [Allokutzneria sp. A3M-2-11 16]|uniref:phage distal tail protein n=1 Tax=Allokutzneria sp. A3M-2-11 16 TaxID=2962043 RepID=UPI0020B648D3|nr:phage tail domain-containing protein [Allokutzneria sp. A3M-2-11 16]MCP3800201.1 phage tail family protein [Allokutzneria sp. A3M-2-11 16]